MSLFADILVLAALVAAAWLGARRGLLKSLAGLLIVLVALWGASWAADHLTEPVAQWIEPRVTQRVERKLEESHAADAGQMLQAFSFRGSGLQKMLDAVHQRVQQTGETVIRAVAQSIARSVAGTAVYVVVFLILLVLLWLLPLSPGSHWSAPPTAWAERPWVWCAAALRCLWSYGPCSALDGSSPRSWWKRPPC